MTLATLILDSLYAGLLLIAAGWLLDALHARLRRASRPRPVGPLADFDGWDHRPYVGPHLTAAREPSPWPR